MDCKDEIRLVISKEALQFFEGTEKVPLYKGSN
jgi:glutamine amidotransferase-like uncharacterized protein